MVSTPACQAGGREFKSRRSRQTYQGLTIDRKSFFIGGIAEKTRRARRPEGAVLQLSGLRAISRPRLFSGTHWSGAMWKTLLAAIVLCILAEGPALAQSDLFISGVTLHTMVRPTTPTTTEEDGEVTVTKVDPYPEVVLYDPNSGLAPENVDVLVSVNGDSPYQSLLYLEVIPVVGATNWARTNGSTEQQLLQKSKTRMPAFFRRSRKLIVGGRSEITFSRINIAEIIDAYAKNGFWPAQIVFRATVYPVAGEVALSNNVMEFILTMTTPY